MEEPLSPWEAVRHVLVEAIMLAGYCLAGVLASLVIGALIFWLSLYGEAWFL